MDPYKYFEHRFKKVQFLEQGNGEKIDESYQVRGSNFRG